MYYTDNGDELKKFNTLDGKGVELLRNAGIKIAIITQEKTRIVERRAQKLRVDHLYQGVHDKISVLKELAGKEGIEPEEMAYIGDDLNDTEALGFVGFSVTPADGNIRNKLIVDYICRKKGGEGCVREVAEILLDSSVAIN